MSRLISRFVQYGNNELELMDFFADKIEKNIVKNDKIYSLSAQYPSARWFERKIRDDFGLVIESCYDKRRLIHHESFPKVYPMRKEFNLFSKLNFDYFEPYDYEKISGSGVFNVSVGPIHAGIIEPGHFHFSQAGEQILHLEVRHFYKYRAVEKMCEGKKIEDIEKIVARISGNESIAYQIGLSNIKYQSKELHQSLEHKLQNAILLEFERLAHHFADIGFIPNDAGFSPALAVGSRYSEDVRRVLKKLTNSRFGFDIIDKELNLFEKKEFILDFLSYLEREINWFEEWIIDIPSLWDRLDSTGILNKKEAIRYGCVGVVARASGIDNDTRSDDNFYTENGFTSCLRYKGDVASRFLVRIDEIKNSLFIIKNMILKLKKTISCNNLALSKDGEYFSLVESSIGEIFMYVKIENSIISRFYVRDPSFINWQALHLMMHNDIIADFPLINKSCDLSYAGNDL